MTDALHDGELKVEGRLTDASNTTLYCLAIPSDGGDVRGDGNEGDGERSPVACVYKPISGENPLWDFPDGTLAAREVAAYEVSVALGWDLVPETILRDGPFGPGMCQRWIEVEAQEPRRQEKNQVLTILPTSVWGRDLDGWCPIMTVNLADDEQGLLAHRDSEELRRIALFDVLINNADRKGGHLLPTVDGRVYAIDHGVTFHAEDKLRTLLWGFADRLLNDSEIADLKRLRIDDALADRVTALLTEPETAALHARIDALLSVGCFPSPVGRHRPVPWPLI